jgi:selenocysteine lyase/cysteine desulfurase
MRNGSCVASAAEDVWRVLMPPPDGYEDGTQNYLGIAQLQYGFAQLDSLGGVAVRTAWAMHCRVAMTRVMGTLNFAMAARIAAVLDCRGLGG